MQARTALIAAIISGSLAIGVVALDVAWSVEVRLDSREGSGWKTVAQAPEHSRGALFQECAAPDLRLVVHNGKPFEDQVDIVLTYYNASASRDETLLRETWSLDASETRTYEFQIPLSAFEDPEDGRDGLAPGGIHVTAIVGEHWLSTCVQAEEEH